MVKRKRHRIEIERDMLNILADNREGIIKTRLLTKANLSTEMINPFLNMLLGNCYIDTFYKKDSYNVERMYIKITQDGYERLLKLRELLKV